MAQLLIQGHGDTIVHDLQSSRNTVGRASSNDIILYDDGVSGCHAEILSEGSGFLVRDLDSSNGTQVNGVRILENSLKDGDIVSFGPVRCAFVLARDGSPESDREKKEHESAASSENGGEGLLKRLGSFFRKKR